jgi:ATP-dependent HslUV protease, peptidase subunit HslV
VQEYSRFYASGSGTEYALGAMFAIYDDEDKTAEDIAKIGVEAGAEFDDGTSLPMNCYTIKLRNEL